MESRFCNPHVVIYLTKQHHHDDDDDDDDAYLKKLQTKVVKKFILYI
jgi:hypothetical protein